jgi:hypothetical protein
VFADGDSRGSGLVLEMALKGAQAHPQFCGKLTRLNQISTVVGR